MEKEDEIKSQHIQLLAQMSKTPQHELIERMLKFYDVQGTINLNSEQTGMFLNRILSERKLKYETAKVGPC